MVAAVVFVSVGLALLVVSVWLLFGVPVAVGVAGVVLTAVGLLADFEREV